MFNDMFSGNGYALPLTLQPPNALFYDTLFEVTTIAIGPHPHAADMVIYPIVSTRGPSSVSTRNHFKI